MTTATQPQRRSREARPTGARERLVGAARTCLRERGPSASSRTISDLAGENLAAITYYFGAKETLVAVALAEELRDLLAEPLAILEGPGDHTRRMLDAVVALNRAFEATREHAPALLEALLAAARGPVTREPLQSLWAEMRARLAATIAALQRDGFVPGWIDADAMAALILAVGAGTSVAAAVDTDGPSHTAVGAQFATLLLAARSA
jgi:AcrR family transcriptional regulator